MNDQQLNVLLRPLALAAQIVARVPPKAKRRTSTTTMRIPLYMLDELEEALHEVGVSVAEIRAARQNKGKK